MLSRFHLSRRLLTLLPLLALGMIWLAGCTVGPVVENAASPLPSTAAPAAVTATPASPFRPVAPAPAAEPPAPRPVPAPERPGLLAGMMRQLKRASAPTPTATPAPVPAPVIVRHGDRIDAIGPVPIATIAPLTPGEGLPPVRLQIPSLALDTPVQRMGWKTVHGVSQWDVVDNAAGHHFDSVYPGERGNVALSGHNNIAGAVFAGVCVIGQPGVAFGLGDEMILVDSGGRRFTYRVNGWHRMKEKNASIAKRQDNAAWLRQTDEAQLTLVTCWPPWSNTHRVVVTGVLTAMSPP